MFEKTRKRLARLITNLAHKVISKEVFEKIIANLRSSIQWNIKKFIYSKWAGQLFLHNVFYTKPLTQLAPKAPHVLGVAWREPRSNNADSCTCTQRRQSLKYCTRDIERNSRCQICTPTNTIWFFNAANNWLQYTLTTCSCVCWTAVSSPLLLFVISLYGQSLVLHTVWRSFHIFATLFPDICHAYASFNSTEATYIFLALKKQCTGSSVTENIKSTTIEIAHSFTQELVENL